MLCAVECNSVLRLLSYNYHKKGNALEKRTARLTILIDPVKKEILEEVCAQHDLTPSQAIRSLVREYINQHGTPEQKARMPAFKKGPKASKNK